MKKRDMDYAIEIRGLVKKFNRFQLGPLDLSVPRGAIYGLIGPNGAGKSTLINLIFGMGSPDAGRIRVCGFDHQAEAVSLKRQAAYVSPDLNYQAWGTIAKAIRFVRGFYPEWDDEACTGFMRSFHLNETERIAALSFGARTKLSLLLALSRRPQVLILDEPLTGLDAGSRQQVFSELLKAVAGGERTVLMASHGLSDIERFADHVGIIKDGRLLLDGRLDEMVGRYRLVEFFISHDPTSQSAVPEGLILLRGCENRWQGLLDQNSGALKWLESTGAQQISLTPVSLEDLFVALFKEAEGE